MTSADTELKPTPTLDPGLPRRFADFDTFPDAVDYAAQGIRGLNFYNGRGQITASLPYSELKDTAVALADRLAGLGFRSCDRIALIAETSPSFLTFFVACQYAGILPVPLPLPTSFGARDGLDLLPVRSHVSPARQKEITTIA